MKCAAGRPLSSLAALLIIGQMLWLVACGEASLPPAVSPAPSPTAGPVTALPPVLSPALTATPVIAPTATTVAATPTALPTATAVPPTPTAAPPPAPTAPPTPTAVPLAATVSPPVLAVPPAPPGAVANEVTPPPLGAAEAALRATGFDGQRAKALLDELTRDIGARVVTTGAERQAADWLEQKFRSLGYSRVERQQFPVEIKIKLPIAPTTGPDATGLNVIAIRPAAGPNAKVLIFGGHFDTVPGTVGASDNGSGTVITLELARALFNRFPDYELRFILFGGEEFGLFGSQHYAGQLSAAEKQRIVAFVNLDALGVGPRFVAIGTADLVAQAIDVAGRNGIRLEAFDLNGTGAGSDHISFMLAGVRSLFLARWIDPQLHKPGDTAERVFPEALLLGGGTAILVAQKLTNTPPW